MKRILIVSHCFLNTASKVKSFKAKAIEAEEALRRAVLSKAVEEGVQLIQLPCPELMLYGSSRWGHTYEQFDNPFYRAQCRELLRPVLQQIQAYLGNTQEFEILGVLGIDGSPSCGIQYTCRGPWGGEFSGRDLQETIQPVALAEGSGVFMKVLQEMLAEANLSLRMEGLFAAEPHRAFALLETRGDDHGADRI